MKFPVLDKNSSEELFYECQISPPPERIQFTGYRDVNGGGSSKTLIVQWTKTYQRQHNPSGYYYTFLKEHVGKKYSAY